MARIFEQTIQPQCTPRELQKIIRGETGTRLYITGVRKAMRRRGLIPKVPQRVHISRAGKEAVRGWQYRFDKRVSCLEGNGFTIVDENEAFFIHDVISGRKYWFPRRERIVVPYTGSHRRIVVYGPSPRTAGSSSGRARALTRPPSSDISRRCRGASGRWRW